EGAGAAERDGEVVGAAGDFARGGAGNRYRRHVSVELARLDAGGALDVEVPQFVDRDLKDRSLAVEGVALGGGELQHAVLDLRSESLDQVVVGGHRHAFAAGALDLEPGGDLADPNGGELVDRPGFSLRRARSLDLRSLAHPHAVAAGTQIALSNQQEGQKRNQVPHGVTSLR